MASKSKATQSDAPVAAREDLETLQAQQRDPAEVLEEKAQEQEKLQAEQLKAGQGQGNDLTDLVPAAQRGTPKVSTVNGFMDNMSRRSAADAIEGHFVDIDPNADGVKEAYEMAGLIDSEGNLAAGGGYYGVYIEPGDIDEDTGIPVNGVVRLRDATNARVSVPYDAMSPADAGGRR